MGEASAGRQVGRRGLVWGGVFGLLPDLDLLYSYGDVVSDFTYHRSWSHSVLVMTAVTPLFVWLILKIHPQTRGHRERWYLLTWLALITHTLLDCFTVYGTQPLWPIPMAPVGWSTVFIIDPAFSLPLLLGVLSAAVFHRRRQLLARRLNTLGLGLSCLYLCWSVGAKYAVERAARAQLADMGVQYEGMLTTPAPFNTLLWRIVVIVPDGYLEGYYSLVSGGPQPEFIRHPNDRTMLAAITDERAVHRLRWFTRGFYAVSLEGDALVMADLRMGSEPHYVFRFVVADWQADGLTPVAPRRFETPTFSRDQLAWVWRRIWSVPAGGLEQ